MNTRLAVLASLVPTAYLTPASPASRKPLLTPACLPPARLTPASAPPLPRCSRCSQVLTQLLLYYTRFLDLVKTAYPNGAPFAKFILSIQTLMGEIRNFSRNF